MDLYIGNVIFPNETALYLIIAQEYFCFGEDAYPAIFEKAAVLFESLGQNLLFTTQIKELLLQHWLYSCDIVV